MKVLLGITGGIAAYKTPKIVSLLLEDGHEVRVVATANGLRFVSSLALAAISGHSVMSDMFEDEDESGMSHIRLPEWADFMLVAPATANILAKAAHGIADDLLSTLLLAAGAGGMAACPVVFSPAMNPRMWMHPATQANLQTLLSWGARIIDPESGRLACSDYGQGRMPEPETILRCLKDWNLLGKK